MTIAVLLAAGSGRRMWPFAELRPKACLPVGNESVAARLAAQLAAAGVDRIVVATDREPFLRETLAGAAQEVRYVSSAGGAGSATAAAAGLAEAARWVPDASVALVLPTDLVLGERDVAALSEAATAGHSGPSALVAPLGADGVPFERAADWICARVEDDRVVEVLGHSPGLLTHRLLGAYALPVGAAATWTLATPPGMTATAVGGMPPDEAELAQTIANRVLAGDEVRALATTGVALDLDKPWHLLVANRWIALERCAGLSGDDIDPTAVIGDRVERRGHVRVGARSRVGPNALIKGNAWIGDDVVIADGAVLEENVIVGDRTHIENSAYVHTATVIGSDCRLSVSAEVEGLLMDNVYVVHHSEVMGVLGRGVDIGAGTVSATLRFDDEGPRIRVAGRVEQPGPVASCSFVGDFSRTGVGVRIAPGVRIGCRSCVGPGVVCMEDVPSDTLVELRQDLTNRPWGPHRYGW